MSLRVAISAPCGLPPPPAGCSSLCSLCRSVNFCVCRPLWCDTAISRRLGHIHPWGAGPCVLPFVGSVWGGGGGLPPSSGATWLYLAVWVASCFKFPPAVGCWRPPLAPVLTPVFCVLCSLPCSARCLCPPPFDSAFRSRCCSRAFGHFISLISTFRLLAYCPSPVLVFIRFMPPITSAA
jgi:hypothetical protein